MTGETFKKAQSLKKEIHRLEQWLNHYECFGDAWRRSIFFKTGKKRDFEFSNSWSALIAKDTAGEYGLELSTEQKEKVVNIIKEDLERLKEEFKRLGTENE